MDGELDSHPKRLIAIIPVLDIGEGIASNPAFQSLLK